MGKFNVDAICRIDSDGHPNNRHKEKKIPNGRKGKKKRKLKNSV